MKGILEVYVLTLISTPQIQKMYKEKEKCKMINLQDVNLTQTRCQNLLSYSLCLISKWSVMVIGGCVLKGWKLGNS
jgi:uncharacterized protein with PQ loop repeat